MCECPGFIGASMENICEGCRAWREKYHYAMGVRCGENISKTAKRAEKTLCSYCWEARAEHHTPRSDQPSAHSGRSTPVQNALLQSPPPPPQLHDICARMEVMLGRMEGVLGLLVSQSQAAALAPPGPPPGIEAVGAPATATAPVATATAPAGAPVATATASNASAPVTATAAVVTEIKRELRRR